MRQEEGESPEVAVGANGTTIRRHQRFFLRSHAGIPQYGPAVSLMNHIAGKVYFGRATRFTGNPLGFCFQSLGDLPGVLPEKNEQSLAINLLLRFLRNAFVHCSMIGWESWFQQYHNNEVVICCMIKVLENLKRTPIPVWCSKGLAGPATD